MSIPFAITTATVRVRTAEGDAFFLMPQDDGTAVRLGNDNPNKWVTYKPGLVFLLCAKFEKTDTFMVAAIDGDAPPQGIILRRASYEKLVTATKTVDAPAEIKPEVVKPAKAGKKASEPITVVHVQEEEEAAEGSEEPAQEEIAADSVQAPEEPVNTAPSNKKKSKSLKALIAQQEAEKEAANSALAQEATENGSKTDENTAS